MCEDSQPAARWQVTIRVVSELCRMARETPIKYRYIRGRSDAYCCCRKSLMGIALVGFDVRQHARAESISKRAPSTTRTSLRRLESTTCERSDVRLLHAVGPFAQFDITLESNGLRTVHSNRAPKLCQTSKSLEITYGR